MLVKIKVRANQAVNFPGICVHCAQPAAEAMLIRKRMSRVTRLIDVPLCPDCAAQLRRTSMEEERLQKLRTIVSGAALVITLLAIFIALPPDLPVLLRFLAALAGAVFVTAVVIALFQHQIKETYLPEKQAVLQAAQIENFSWRATTFSFANELFRQRFVEMNEPLLMEI